jgi:hypothetical protein
MYVYVCLGTYIEISVVLWRYDNCIINQNVFINICFTGGLERGDSRTEKDSPARQQKPEVSGERFWPSIKCNLALR